MSTKGIKGKRSIASPINIKKAHKALKESVEALGGRKRFSITMDVEVSRAIKFLAHGWVAGHEDKQRTMGGNQLRDEILIKWLDKNVKNWRAIGKD